MNEFLKFLYESEVIYAPDIGVLNRKGIKHRYLLEIDSNKYTVDVLDNNTMLIYVNCTTYSFTLDDNGLSNKFKDSSKPTDIWVQNTKRYKEYWAKKAQESDES